MAVIGIIIDYPEVLSGLIFFSFLIYHLSSFLSLCDIPGPFLAGWTNISRWRWAKAGRAHEIHQELHKKYGKLVRLGPNMVSVGDPGEIPHIYNYNGSFPKSDFYLAFLPISRGHFLPGMFSTQNGDLHKLLKKPVAAFYSMSHVLNYEPRVDSTTRCLFEQLDKRFVETGKPCDFSTYLQMYAFDVIGEVTFSRRLGFLDLGEDVEGIMHDTLEFLAAGFHAAMMPWTECLWRKNKIISRLRPGPFSPMSKFVEARARESEALGDPDKGGDFSSDFRAAMAKDPRIPRWAFLAWGQSNISAGSDTTAITLRAMFYYLLRNPETLQKLRREIDTLPPGDLINWKDAKSLPYLDACVKETLRVHPAIGTPLERVVPEGGATICGRHFKAGTVIGISPWVAHQDSGIFGEDVDKWRPERWLADEDTRRRMERGLFAFGGGNRVCIGKHIAELEIYKIIPALIRRYNIEFEKPDTEWVVRNMFVVHQFNLWVRLTKRGDKFAKEM